MTDEMKSLIEANLMKNELIRQLQKENAELKKIKGIR